MLIHMMISNCSFGLHFYSVLKPTQILSQICYQFSIWISLRYLSLFHYLFVCSSSSLPWSTSSHISESRRIASRRLLVYWKQKLCETTINKTTQICDAAWFHLGGWKDIETYCFTFNRKKSTWHDGKVHFKGKKNTNFKQRLRLSSDPQQNYTVEDREGIFMPHCEKECSPTGPSGRHDCSTGTSSGFMTLFWNANTINT